ncbi:uncharacterized protein LOC122277554 isoform X1 [Carya illinoinensis]|uniref:Phorbol-ester/DAG-type domain-containing protein n=1 Tax=Carya illinoinensis TaxID=32201 RepID=A0A8T1PFL2_CARIL|nr:uncharacterized protein LOC122277554 isoform X1 [Carya illinoinensis]XP_042943505.1 uncharacterized protein LOC122277554 isoform X1 [Carya illinoinensis]KAG6640818.1 hypothetical protein CIPAW_09G029900 [Carya illinoinensis]
MDLKHFSHRHPLIFIEEVKNEGKKDIICSGCNEPILGPAYKCSKCNFLLHQSCTQLPREIQHPLHPNDALILQAPSASSRCDACRRFCSRCFYYRCDWCNFDLDIKCASRWQSCPDKCHQHAFVPIMNQIQFACEACGVERKDIAYLCNICRLLVHYDCTEFPRTIKITGHDHSLTLTYSLHHVKEDHNIFCKLCYKKVNTKYAAYYCQRCSYLAHLTCATDTLFEDRIADYSSTADFNSFSNDSFDFVTLRDGEGAREMQYFCHHHSLIFNDEELKDDELCEGCMQLISAPFYSCQQCKFFIHKRCTELPTKKRHLLHRHVLTLHSQAPSIDGVFYCNACKHYRHGFTYRCDECQYNLDVQCGSMPECLKHEGHQHPLFLAINSDEECNACDYNDAHRVYVCTDCSFTLGFKCATLPLEVTHKYDTHPLKLTYTAEDDSGEYYCLVCEEERDPNHWFYYCEDCDFAAHPQCVLGEYPYIKFGTSYTNEQHPHPLIIVQRSKYSHPCDACDLPFDGVATECTQCKFNIHLWDDCLWNLTQETVK